MEYKNLHDIREGHKNKIAAPVGVVMLILAIVGFIALCNLGVRLTQQLLDNSKEKEMFEELIRPVLMFDPPPFEDITALPNTTLLEPALWATMLGEKRETYAFDPQNNLIVPSSDVDVVAARLFGPDVKLEHMSFPSDFGVSYEYNETDKAYRIPVMSATTLYTPRVDEIERDGDIYSLLVGYIPPATAWNADISGGHTQPDPHKYMIYKLKKTGKFFQLIAIEDPPPEKQVTYASVVENSNDIASVSEQPLSSSEPMETENVPAEEENFEDESQVESESGADESETEEETVSDENTSS